MEARNISLRRGETQKVNLGGLGGAGYIWEFSVEGPPNIVEVSTEQLDTSAPPPPGGYPPNSSSTDTILVIKALNSGKIQIKLSLRRPWEQNKPPLKQLSLQLEISK